MARKPKSRLNKLLEFIGLVDDETDDESGEDELRGGRTYDPPSRKAAQDARPIRSAQSSYDSRNPDRYTPSGRSETNQRPVRDRDYDRQPARNERDSERAAYVARSADLSSSVSRAPRGRDYDRQPPRQDAPRLSSRADYDRYTSSQRSQDGKASAPRDEFSQSRSQRARGNVVSIRQDSRPQTVIYYLRTLDECRDVINDLLDNKTVLLNLEDMDERIVQRAIDTLSGAAFALNATLRKASDKTYLIAPTNVEVALTNDMERRY